MTDENWSSFEAQHEDLNTSLEAIEETLGTCFEFRLGKRIEETLRAVCGEIRNAKLYASAIYSTCENDHCEADDSVDISQYEEVIEMLPSGNLSVGEVESLKEHINQWKVENGYSTNC